DAEAHLQSIQLQMQNNGHSDSLLHLEKKAQLDLDTALDRQEVFWKEKSKVKWHLEGDRNTAYFHRIAKIKNTTKLISSLKHGAEILTDPAQIADHVVQYYKNLFCTNPILQEQILVEQVIPNLVGQDTNALLTMIPSKDEIKHAVFDLNKDGAPGPDGFGAYFYQTYWDIIQHDVTNAVLQFFSTGWILPNYNSNTIILIPKTDSADSIDKYRPIAIANFKFKIISKVLADRLAQILPSIVSKEQRGFIQGRNIKDCICIASEAINLLHNKTFGGNLALKIDITKAFDTLDWSFLIKVLQQFGFNTTFCNWIKSILASASMSISINGALNGYFNCTRGVRQGDPLSPLLFCLAEEVLSRGISLLVDEGKIELIKGSRNTRVPSHCLYADDIMVFCKGKLSSLQALQNLFISYANCSGQVINASKSTIFAGGISQARLDRIVDLIGFNVGSLPFNYLGVPIFKGKPKARYFYPIADKIKAKLSAWKASLLSIAGRAQLVKSVIHSMLMYNISVYAWPISLLKTIETWSRNFIWSGDISKRKLVTVAWKKVFMLGAFTL
ncbi:ribonuclease H, partial [Trifolium pratense]